MARLDGSYRGLFFLLPASILGAGLFTWLRFNGADAAGPFTLRPAYLSAMIAASLAACVLCIAIPLLPD